MNSKKYFSGIKEYLLQSCLCVTALLLLISPAVSSLAFGEDAGFEIIRVESWPVDAAEHAKKPVTDFYINGGEELGIRSSMVLDVYRDKLILNTSGDNTRISVPVGQVKVVKAYKDISIARIKSLTSSDKTPDLQYRTIMLGDYAVLKGNKEPQVSLHNYKESTPGSGVTVPSEVLFSLNDWKLKLDAKEVLSRIHDHYNNAGDKRIIVEGHTCSLGPEKYNMELSEKRARSVREYFLNAKGISPEKITIESHGEKKPVASNNMKEGRSKNRRVNIRFLPIST